jgi:CRISPR/Cas system CSM-associated protein Csm4 (group 5 of RAMP superfamily)
MTAATNAAYRIASVAGWLRSPDGPAQRRKRIHLLEEGSLIPMSKNVAGDLVDVAPDYGRNEESSPDRLPHPVYRAGFAVAAGLAKEANHG